MRKNDPFMHEASPEALIPPADNQPMTPQEMETARRGIVAEHKARCDGRLESTCHLDGAAWFAWEYQCKKCGTGVYIQQARRPDKKYYKWNQVTSYVPEH